MAFSLEAALVVPLAICTWTGFLALLPASYLATAITAEQERQATRFLVEEPGLYRTEQIESHGRARTALHTSPQLCLEWLNLIRDDGRLILDNAGFNLDDNKPISSSADEPGGPR